ncbi:MAG: DUF4363 family protein [Firmicutes bacterium]|nr:DUF4363 family protein [Bacillota bacterium]
MSRTRAVLGALIVLVLAFFLFVMAGASWLKRPWHGRSDDVSWAMNEAWRAIQQEKWSDAGPSVRSLQAAWRQVSPRIQFSVEIDDLMTFDESLERLKAAVAAKDKASGLVELATMKSRWRAMD